MHEQVAHGAEALSPGGRVRLQRSSRWARRHLNVRTFILVALCSCENDCSNPAGGAAGPPPGIGSINVTTTTTGTDLDPDGYQVTVGQDTRTMLPNAFERFQNLAFGAHTASLAGQADNCSVANNPRQITVSVTAAISTTFDVTCVANIAALSVETSTLGTVPDPDGYTVTVAGQTRPASLNGTLVFNPVPVGNQLVQLGSIVQGCAVVLGNNPRTVPVGFSTTNFTRFVVGCSVGQIFVTTATTGVEYDPDGYFLSVDSVLYSLGVNATLQTDFLPVGAHQVGLGNVSPNCAVAGANPRTIAVTAQPTVGTRFDVSCVPAVRVAFESNRDGDFEIFTVRPDGTELRPVTTNGFDDVDPDWSPDGTKIAFARHGDIWMMNADGTNEHVVLLRTQDDDDPDWSPDGKRILFESDAADGTREIFVMDTSGTNLRQLTNATRDSRKPHFSPNGASVVFVSDRFGNDDVFTMDSSGTNLLRLTTDPAADHDPAWSPKGNEIVFSSARDGDQELWIMNADGSAQTQKTFNTFGDWGPAWAADGTIAFSTDRNGNVDIYLLTATSQLRLTAHAGNDGYADWRLVPLPNPAQPAPYQGRRAVSKRSPMRPGSVH